MAKKNKKGNNKKDGAAKNAQKPVEAEEAKISTAEAPVEASKPEDVRPEEPEPVHEIPNEENTSEKPQLLYPKGNSPEASSEVKPTTSQDSDQNLPNLDVDQTMDDKNQPEISTASEAPALQVSGKEILVPEEAIQNASEKVKDAVISTEASKEATTLPSPPRESPENKSNEVSNDVAIEAFTAEGPPALTNLSRSQREAYRANQ
ncbi:hypothetical protein DSO57_1034180 [Entomophthora muscae]|uniref:Uncharacterized protein n=1 Tax=Entomophthora muscae TaxID=34485 RepID=A0ACC2T018_9FUNG|nr:hypothetical protein DSO57_1034180 [Entomophthora muscae]